jgi:CheY-like chemotaxis protein
MATILIVEDDQWMADCYRAWLAAGGHTVRHARDAQEAIDSIDNQPPDVIMLDLLLPYANGVQVLHTLRSHHDLANIPIILCSSALPKDIADLTPYGVCKMFDKSALSPDILQRAVREVITHAAV